MKLRDIVDWNVYWLLFVVAEFTLFLALPYSISIAGDAIYDFGVSLPIVLATQFAQATILFLVSIFTGLYLGNKVGLEVPILKSLLEGNGLPESFAPTMKLSLLLGALLGTVIFILDWFVFSMFTEPLITRLMAPPLWERVMYSFYAGIVEEIVLRFFLMTLLVWISWKIKKTSDNRPTNVGVWLAIFIVSLIYGLGYLASSSSMDMERMHIMGIILLNGIAGIVFGWLYWKKGLEASIIANLTASLVLFVVLGSFF
ncbi:CPBP family intramembrane glutamic endopeptidase [Methanolobus mangrovi]|uniref:CPBP family intramembrane glutamic endopeptidase n=1 Tax=Methanolobus mangrovi TaxID=3072977 RepID=A0AA51YK99_9EURY|nr:CPBP family intramembrane glutamic endopeptidase [Methanolobus mangrovi]WMW22984.1 CPBP family intramembrane glutamic endopeptidase [Methanolobus mangrovi]